MIKVSLLAAFCSVSSRCRLLAWLGLSLLAAASASAQPSRVINALQAWGSEGTANGQFQAPAAIAVRLGYIYVLDSYNDRLQEFTDTGRFYNKWPAGPGRSFERNRGLAVDLRHGYIYVAETPQHRILKYDNNGNIIKSWGSYGDGPGQFNHLIGIAVGPDGNIYTADNALGRVQVFDAHGNQLREWIMRQSNNQRVYPTAIAVSSDNEIFLTETTTRRVYKYNLSGTFLGSWPTLASYPFSIAVSPNGKIVLVTDGSDPHIQVYDSNGTAFNPLSVWSTHPSGHTVQPVGVAFLRDDQALVIENRFGREPTVVKFSVF